MMSNKQETIEEMDDYQKAASYLMGKALSAGDGFMLRAIKTIMDRVEVSYKAGMKDSDMYEALDEVNMIIKAILVDANNTPYTSLIRAARGLIDKALAKGSK